MSRKLIDLTGKRFGRLTVISRTYSTSIKGIIVKPGIVWWKCLCDCGQEKEIKGSSLRRKDTISCGCYRKQMLSNPVHLYTKESKQKSKENHASRTHGMTKTPTYRVWTHMRERCKVHPYYVAKGIKVCDLWENSFEAFYAEMGERPSAQHQIDRIDGNRGYEPGNCRWVLSKENNRNKCNNVFIEYKGRRLCVGEWSEITNISNTTIHRRLKAGWDAESILTTPPKILGQRKEACVIHLP